MEVPEKSIYSDYIKTIDDLLADFDLRSKCLSVLRWDYSTKRDMIYSTRTDESNFQIVLLLQELGFIKITNNFTPLFDEYVEFTFESNKVLDFVDQMKGRNTIIKKQSLEFIARRMGEVRTGPQLIDFLKDNGVPNSLIVYPNTKWVMVNDILVYYASTHKKDDGQMLFKIIGHFCHPLIHHGDEASSAETIKKFNTWLGYDSGYIGFDEQENNYAVYFNLTEKDKQEVMADLDATQAKEEQDKFQVLCQPENKEKISLLRKNYQVLMAVVETFCRNFTQLSHEELLELNRHYLMLDKLVCNAIEGLQIQDNFDTYRKYPRPFSNLFSAEKELKGEVSWDVIRREMSARFGEIETLYQKVNGSEILADPDQQKQLNGIILYLSELKEKTTAEKSTEEMKEMPVTKIEITKMPDLFIKGSNLFKGVFQEPSPTKSGKVIPTDFPSDLQWKEIAIQFITTQEVIVKAKGKSLNTNFEGMGFMDEKKKLPNKQWELLIELSKRNGELSWQNNKDLPQKDVDAIKKRKQLLSDALKGFFQIQNDPFSDYAKGKSYKIKIHLIPQQASEEPEDKLGIKEYLKNVAPEINDQA